MRCIRNYDLVWLQCFLAAGCALAAEAPVSALKFFRSDRGVASDSGPLPERFDLAGVLSWRVELDPGHSSPVVYGDKIFLTTYREGAKELAAVAMDKSSGRTLWRQAVAVSQVEQTHVLGSPATATPACDGQRVYVFYGSYGLLCYDLEGKKLWEHPLGPFRDEYGAGSSPILVGDKLILNQDHDMGSFLMAIDAVTGRTIWQSTRPDAVRSYATPSVWVRNGREEVLVAGALELAAYDPGTGERLWWSHGLARIVIPTPIPNGDRIYMASWAPGGDAGRRLDLGSWQSALEKWDKNHDGKLAKDEVGDPEVLDRFFRMDINQDGRLDEQEWERHAAVFRRAQNAVMAIKPSGRGELDGHDVVWTHRRGVPYVATPLVDQGRLWMVKDGGIVTKLDASDGRLLQEERIPGMGNYFASPVAGDGKVYFASENGVLSVLSNQPEWRVLSSHDFHEKIYATPAIGRERIYVRTEKALYSYQGGKN